jgi:phosphoribosylformylglycinamidine cyclo-ligase
MVPGVGKAGEALLAPHISYLKPLMPLVEQNAIHALAHITGGGLKENTPRALPEYLGVELERGAWPIPPVFTALQRTGGISPDEMWRTFNMGAGMVVICSRTDAEAVRRHLEGAGSECFEIGRVTEGSREVRLA